ncbi:hypothetical protein NSPZN2_70208 [Nitrospira defluvii]|uniref:Uncharacterized protein n=1 Tax=Nitrospira defluvii TaxID=330214 RepID=A0ABM8SAR7_9BACT|nr:hypothetical protein NSPZN2_70208 [Nitrospira defluvii]
MDVTGSYGRLTQPFICSSPARMKEGPASVKTRAPPLTSYSMSSHFTPAAAHVLANADRSRWASSGPP